MKLFFSNGQKGPHVPAEGFIGTQYETIFASGPIFVCLQELESAQ